MCRTIWCRSGARHDGGVVVGRAMHAAGRVISARYVAARRLLLPLPMGRAALACACVLMTACVVPLPIDNNAADADGGVNGYPVIKDSTKPMPGPININRTTADNITLTLSDADLGDTLFVRVFRDYDKGNIVRIADTSVKNDPQSGKEDRQVLLSTSGWCIGTPTDDTALHQFDVVVTDRTWNDGDTTAPFKVPVPGGKVSTRSWLGKCISTP